MGQLSSQSDSSDFIFVLVHLKNMSCWSNIHPWSDKCCISRVGRDPCSFLTLSHSFLPLTVTWRWQSGSLSNQKCTGKRETCSHRQWNSTRGGHSSASMLAPKLRMKTSVVYLGDELQASLWCPMLFTGHLCTYRLILANQCMWMYKCLLSFFICLFGFCKQKGAQLNWSSRDICSSSSSEQLFVCPGLIPPDHLLNIIYLTWLFP